MTHATSETLLDTAALAAAAGRYATATTLLAAVEAGGSRQSAALLRARMAAQQGRFEEAIDHFREVLLADPGHREARAGLEKVRTLKRRPAGRLRLQAHAGLLLVLTLLLPPSLWFLAGTLTNGPPAPAAVPPARMDEVSAVHPPAPEPALVLDLEKPGLVTQRDGDDLIIRFERGLFASGRAELSAEAVGILRSLGQSLKASPSPLVVSVQGHTDDVPTAPGARFRDNQDLAMARAVAVISFLRRETGLPGQAFSAWGLGVESAPYPPGEPSARARNRTVVLRIGQRR